MPAPDYAEASRLMDEADKGRKAAGLTKLTKAERAWAITYFCEGARWQRSRKTKPGDAKAEAENDCD